VATEVLVGVGSACDRDNHLMDECILGKSLIERRITEEITRSLY